MDQTVINFDVGDNQSTTEVLPVDGSSAYGSPLLWASILSLLFFWYMRDGKPVLKVPLVTKTTLWDLTGRKARQQFAANARGVVERGFKMVGGAKPFRVISDQGEMLILPPYLAHDIRNIHELSHGVFMKESTCAEVPGFEPFLVSTDSPLLSDMTKTKLTASLKWLSNRLSATAADSCTKLLPQDDEWQEIAMKDVLLDFIARLSSAIFLGEEDIADNADWLRITKEYTVDSFLASHQLRPWPRFLRPYIAHFLPKARKTRQHVRDAEAIFNPVLERRRAENRAGKGTERLDSIEWLEEATKGKNFGFTPVVMQLNLALSAIHTTTDLITTTMYDILQHPTCLEDMREEMVAVIKESNGLQHSSLYHLKLTDSVVKESQRLKPALSVNMVRTATGPIDLPDGLHIPKGTRLGVSAQAAWDPAVFPNPEQFDPYRFVRLSETPGSENRWQLSTTRPEHIAFGHGKHACPGRFLAANEIKIALCHLLLKYDWKLKPQSVPRVFVNGIMMDSDPTTRVMVRRRQPEVDI